MENKGVMFVRINCGKLGFSVALRVKLRELRWQKYKPGILDDGRIVFHHIGIGPIGKNNRRSIFLIPKSTNDCKWTRPIPNGNYPVTFIDDHLFYFQVPK